MNAITFNLSSCPKVQPFRTYSDLNKERIVYQRNATTDFILSLAMLITSEMIAVETKIDNHKIYITP